MREASKTKDQAWRWIGPKNISGRTIDIAVVAPKGKNYTLYAATASGGLWKTDNEGTTWASVLNSCPSAAIGDITVAPSNPDIVWAGTGEANIFRSSQAGIGVYKSVDAGKTWAPMGLENTYTIPRIVIHPANPDIVYVAASGHEWTDNSDRGVYKTTDGGKTWQKVLGVNGPDRARSTWSWIHRIPRPSTRPTWQRIRIQMERSPQFPRRLHEGAGSPKRRRRQDLEAREHGPAGGPAPRPDRHRRSPAGRKPEVVYAFVDNYEMSRKPDRRRARRTPTACPRAGSSRARPSSGRTTRARPGNRPAA